MGWFNARARATDLVGRFLHWVIFITLLGLAGLSAYPLLQANSYGIGQSLSAVGSNSVESVAITIGAGLIGATAIISSLILFAMQVNVERMPHGLFRRLSRDRFLIGAFGMSFLLALCVTFSPLLLEPMWAVWWTIWATVCVIWLFYLAYERSLNLVNPSKQLAILAREATDDLKRWGKHARRLGPAYAASLPVLHEEGPFTSRHDLGMLLFFRGHPHWQTKSKQAVDYAISMAHRAAEHGDYEASATALNAIGHINRGYIKAKGLTFFQQTPFFANPLSGDGFITHSLEHLRQTIAVGLKRGDEQQIIQVLDAYAGIAVAYLEVDYGQDHASHSETSLAAGYLSSDLKRLAETEFADVVMNGVRQLGAVARAVVERAKPEETHTIIDALGVTAISSLARTAKGDLSGVATGISVGELSRLFSTLLASDHYEVSYTLSEIQKQITLIATLVIHTPDQAFGIRHSSTLGPFYSLTSDDTTARALQRLSEILVERPAEDEQAKRILRHLEGWADQLASSQRELLQKAIEHRSKFVFDLTHWLSHVTKVLLYLTTAPACGDHTRRELRKHAFWMASAFSWIPADKEVVAWIEAFHVTDQLFDMTRLAYQLELKPDETIGYCKLLLDWAFKASREPNGWAILASGLSGLVALAVADGAQTILLALIRSRLKSEPDFPQDERDRTARRLREKSRRLGYENYRHSRIDAALRAIDQESGRECLIAVADLLSPASSSKTHR